MLAIGVLSVLSEGIFLGLELVRVVCLPDQGRNRTVTAKAGHLVAMSRTTDDLALKEFDMQAVHASIAVDTAQAFILKLLIGTESTMRFFEEAFPLDRLLDPAVLCLFRNLFELPVIKLKELLRVSWC